MARMKKKKKTNRRRRTPVSGEKPTGPAQGLAAAAEESSKGASALTLREDKHLLDNPGDGLLLAHKARVVRLMQFGEALKLAAEHPDFGGKKPAEMVAATQQMLRDKPICATAK